MSVIIALILILFIGFKIIIEKSASMEAAHKRDEWKSAHDEWCASVTDKNLEDELELFIYNNPTYAGELARKICPLLPKDQQDKTNSLRILLAQRGKIRHFDALFGIKTPFYSPKPALKMKQQYMVFYVYITWLNNYLEKNGFPKNDLYFVPDYPGSNSPSFININDKSELIRCGTYVWSPQRIETYFGKR